MKRIIPILIVFLISSCSTYNSVVTQISGDLNSRFASTFFDKALAASQIDMTQVDTVYVLEHYYDITGIYDSGMIWTNKGDMQCFKLITPSTSEPGREFRSFGRIEIIETENFEKFDFEKKLINTWNIDEIRRLDKERQEMSDGTFNLVRIIRIGCKYEGSHIQFNDLRDFKEKRN